MSLNEYIAISVLAYGGSAMKIDAKRMFGNIAFPVQKPGIIHLKEAMRQGHPAIPTASRAKGSDRVD
jgi:hypothetical protein